MRTPAGTAPQKVVALGVADEGVRTAIAFALETRGYGIHALAVARGSRPDHLASEADCLVLDCEGRGSNFPEDLARWWGVELGRPVIVLTSTPGLPLLRVCVELGAQVIEKPLLGETLLKAIAGLPEIKAPGR
ncbi:response regulator [Alteraurantiacibacter buctensis]|uniref:Response regulator n=1 Tax=Alteraurantiacibacter buctensis TaxID=1503981 RepID=A0A844YXA3_9SPHN|nr:response regulator [Alteraurantiacibacter buctensis]MXO72975.1 hypothetical protein [Alteraurantiacibacter buctensis]